MAHRKSQFLESKRIVHYSCMSLAINPFLNLKPQLPLEVQLTRLKPPYFGHISRRPSALGKAVMLGWGGW